MTGSWPAITAECTGTTFSISIGHTITCIYIATLSQATLASFQLPGKPCIDVKLHTY